MKAVTNMSCPDQGNDFYFLLRIFYEMEYKSVTTRAVFCLGLSSV